MLLICIFVKFPAIIAMWRLGGMSFPSRVEPRGPTPSPTRTSAINVYGSSGARGRVKQFKECIDIEGWHDPVYRDALEMTGQVHALNHLNHPTSIRDVD